MSAQLPERIDPRRAVVAGDRYRGDLPLAAMSRLVELLEPATIDGADPPTGQVRDRPAATTLPAPPQSGLSDLGQVTYDLAFGRDSAGRATVTGRVQALLPLRCERCAEPMALPVDAALLLAVVEGLDEAAALPETHDPLLLGDAADGRPDGRSIAPRELIEDELILAIPVVVRHADGQCPVDWSGLVRIAAPASAAGASATEAAVDATTDPAGSAAPTRPNPFAALAALKDSPSEN